MNIFKIVGRLRNTKKKKTFSLLCPFICFRTMIQCGSVCLSKVDCLAFHFNNSDLTCKCVSAQGFQFAEDNDQSNNTITVHAKNEKPSTNPTATTTTSATTTKTDTTTATATTYATTTNNQTSTTNATDTTAATETNFAIATTTATVTNEQTPTTVPLTPKGNMH